MKTLNRIAMTAALAALLALAFSASAAAAAGPSLKVTSLIPDYATPGKPMVMFVSIQNDGDEPLAGNLSLRYTFPAGMNIVDPESNASSGAPHMTCQVNGQVDECEADVTGVAAGRQIRYQTNTSIESSASGQLLLGEVEVSGGGSGDDVSIPISITADPDAPFAFKGFDVSLQDAPTSPPAQAAADPTAATTSVELFSAVTNNLDFPSSGFAAIAPAENFRDVVVHVPPGLVGNPNSTPVRCTIAQLQTQKAGTQVSSCPTDSQVGLVQLNGGDLIPLYNLVPKRGAPAEFGFFYQSVTVTLVPRIRPGDNGIDIVSEKTPSAIPIPKFAVEFWGVPSEPSHDRLRPDCLYLGFGNGGANCPTQAPRAAFLRNPTSCTGQPLPWEIEMNTYLNPGVFHKAATTSPAMQGCDNVPFDPDISLTPTSRGAHSSSGLDVNLTLPQENGPDGLAEGDLKEATVTLPEGVAINPSSADGLAACNDGELRLGLEGPSDCPDASKLGSVEVTTPLLDHPIGGSVFLRSQASNDPASGDLYRLAIELRSDDDGIAIRLPGSLKADPSSGQLTANFKDLPQLPFESMQLHFKTGARAPLTTPASCGTYSTHAELASWARPDEPESINSSFTVDQDCVAPPFAPGFSAGVTQSTAGRPAPFALRITRGDGESNISRIDATLPEGELAKLAGVGICPDAAAATGACPVSSQVGSTSVGAGTGSNPLYLPQAGKEPTAVYFSGPYKGAPYSLVVKVPAQAGPFDLGTVAVRSAIRIDPVTTQVTVSSDPLPQIIAGVPISYRDIRVLVDRPGYTINPTSCEPKQVTAKIASSQGGTADVSDRFQVTDCAALGFKPGLSFHLAGKTTRGGHPALTAVLQMPKKGANANVSKAVVSLPHSEFLAQSHIQTVCTRVQYAAGAGGGAECPKGSVYGRARAFTPLLDYPLEGPVYLRSNGGDRELPDLVASLGGQIHIDLVGYVDSNRKTGGIRSTFANVPDAPVSKFVLKMPGGKKSLLENSTNICRGEHRAIVKMDGQNGKIHDFRPLVRASCGKSSS